MAFMLAKPTPHNVNHDNDRFSMFNKKRDIPPSPADFHLRISDAGRKALARHEPMGDGTRLVLIVLMLFVLGFLAGIVAGAFMKT